MFSSSLTLVHIDELLCLRCTKTNLSGSKVFLDKKGNGPAFDVWTLSVQVKKRDVTVTSPLKSGRIGRLFQTEGLSSCLMLVHNLQLPLSPN